MTKTASGCAPHPIHDNMQYLCNEYNDPKCKEKNESYMKQLGEYIEEVDDELAKSVYKFLEKGLLRECCIRPLSAAIRAAFSGQTGPY